MSNPNAVIELPPVPDWSAEGGVDAWQRDLDGWRAIHAAETAERVRRGQHPKAAHFAARVAVTRLAFPHVDPPIALCMTILEEAQARRRAGTPPTLGLGVLAAIEPVVRSVSVAIGALGWDPREPRAEELFRSFSAWSAALGDEMGRAIEAGQDFNFVLLVLLTELRTGEPCPPIRAEVIHALLEASKGLRERNDLDAKAREAIFRRTFTSMRRGLAAHPFFKKRGARAARELKQRHRVQITKEDAAADILALVYEKGHIAPIATGRGALAGAASIRDLYRVKRDAEKVTCDDEIVARASAPKDEDGAFDAAELNAVRDLRQRRDVDRPVAAYLDWKSGEYSLSQAAKRHSVSIAKVRGAHKRAEQLVRESLRRVS